MDAAQIRHGFRRKKVMCGVRIGVYGIKYSIFGTGLDRKIGDSSETEQEQDIIDKQINAENGLFPQKLQRSTFRNEALSKFVSKTENLNKCVRMCYATYPDILFEEKKNEMNGTRCSHD
jgi:hypothetical protein